MAIISCRECTGKVSDAAVACPHCGAPVSAVAPAAIAAAVSRPAQAQKMHPGYWFFFAFVALSLIIFVVGVAGGESTGGTETDIDRRAYKKCLSELKNAKSSGYPDAVILKFGQRCEALRQDFLMKWKIPA